MSLDSSRSDTAGHKELFGCLGNVLAAIIGGIFTLIVADKLSLPSLPVTQPTQQIQVTQVAQLASMVATAQSYAATLVYGPSDGELYLSTDGFLEITSTYQNISDFVVEARFTNPYDGEKAQWSYGFLFRETASSMQYRLYVIGNRTWYLDLAQGLDQNKSLIHKPIAQGVVENFRTAAGEDNLLRLSVHDNTALFFVNNQYVANLDVSEKNVAGNISIGIEFRGEDSTLAGLSTRYENFTVWSLP
jgi:hypothetical protein